MIHSNKIEKQNKNNKNNTIVITSKAAATTLLTLTTIVIVSGVTAPLTVLGSNSREESAITTFDRPILLF
jgi:hypothetical protein